MIPFHTIAVPHHDILAGKIKMEVFAADLWEAFKGTAPDEYKDPTQFFQKTYQTDGLKNLLSIVEERLNGRGGDPVIQLQTPFGGGKTHALIAMYHKANEWNAQKVGLVGTPMGPSDTLWGGLEKQLTGKVAHFDGLTSPGRDRLQQILSQNQPVLILMDEVLEYMTKAAGVPVGDSTLASQTLAFMQELTEAAAILERVALVITLPSGYDQGAAQLLSQLRHVAGRVKKLYTPVHDHEIAQVIRRRLFSQIDSKGAGGVIRDFMDYADRESILPPGTEPSEYRKRFEAAYPFQPEVIEVLYQRWGSFPSFQRTRGVLRLLSFVIHSLKQSAIPYISLADFDLSVQGIRQELLEHIGLEYESIISADITGENAGAKKVDVSLGAAYNGLKLGSRAATTVFLYSFSGGTENGANLEEIKRSATTTGHPSSVLTEAVEGLQEKLFYLQHESGRAHFTNQPNLNSILLTRMENINERAINEFEEAELKKNLSGGKLKTFVWPKDGSDIPDSTDLKLIILKERDDRLMKDILEMKGKAPRVNRNTLFFLTPLDHEAAGFYRQLRKIIAYEGIGKDKTLNLSAKQQREVRTELRKATAELNDGFRRYYRTVFIPAKNNLKASDLGLPTYGVSKKLDEGVYDKLRLDGEILESVHPLVVKEKYLETDESVSTEQLYQLGAKTPGETRVVGQGWELGICDGVEQGLFGLGELDAGKPVCRYFKERPSSIAFSGSEVIIQEDICIAQEEPTPEPPGPIPRPPEPVDPPGGDGEGEIEDPPAPEPPPDGRDTVRLKFTIPKGKVSGLMGVMNLLQSNFDNLQIELQATGGQMSDQDYEDKIKETFMQLGIDLEE